MRHYIWAIAWGIIVLFLISTPINAHNPTLSRFNFPGVDKLVHAGVFFVFTSLSLFGALKNCAIPKVVNFSIIITLAFSSVFAIGTELIQEYLTTTRTFDLWDIFADHVGIGMSYFSYVLFVSTMKKIQKESSFDEK